MRFSPSSLCGSGLLLLAALLVGERTVEEGARASAGRRDPSYGSATSDLQDAAGRKRPRLRRETIDPRSLLPALAVIAKRRHGSDLMDDPPTAEAEELGLHHKLDLLSASQLQQLIDLVSGNDDEALPLGLKKIPYEPPFRTVGDFKIPECLGGSPSRTKPEAATLACAELIRRLAMKDPSRALAALTEVSQAFGQDPGEGGGMTTLGGERPPFTPNTRLRWMLSDPSWFPAIQAAAMAAPETAVNWVLNQPEVMRRGSDDSPIAVVSITVATIASTSPPLGVEQACRFMDRGLWKEAVEGLAASATTDEKRLALVTALDDAGAGVSEALAIPVKMRLAKWKEVMSDDCPEAGE